jgi:hypothetical protein
MQVKSLATCIQINPCGQGDVQMMGNNSMNPGSSGAIWRSMDSGPGTKDEKE